jgi:tetratricopeptide (TPR) repeat protein
MLLVLVSLGGIYAYQQANRPPVYTGPPPTVRTTPPPVPAPAPAPVAEIGEAEAMALEDIARAISEQDGDRIEAQLRALHGQFPGSAEVLTQLARLEYGRAIAGRSQPRGGLPMNWDSGHMDAARRWAAQAVAGDPGLAGAWLVSAQIQLAYSNPRESLAMLERAEALDPTSVKLRLRKGETLRAMAEYTRENAYLVQSVAEYERAIQGPADSQEEFVALRQIGEAHAALGDNDKATAYLTRAIAGFEGSDRAFTLEARARIQLEAGQVDASIRDSQAALEIMRFGVAAHTLADAQLVKAGLAMKNQREAAAEPLLKAFLAFDRDPTSHVNHLAYRQATFPAVYAMFAAPMRSGYWDRFVPEALVESANFVTANDLRKLKALGVQFDAGDQATNRLLFMAIRADNVDAVRELLTLGADTSGRRDDGATLLDAARIGTQPKRKEIRRLLLASMGRPEGWTDVDVDLPTPGRWYYAERTVGVAENPGDKVFEAGMTLMAGNVCSTPGRPYTCFTFYTAPEKMYGTIIVPISRPEDFNALREVEAPTP